MKVRDSNRNRINNSNNNNDDDDNAILVTAELDEKNGSLQTTAILKNNPAVKVSCSLSTASPLTMLTACSRGTNASSVTSRLNLAPWP